MRYKADSLVRSKDVRAAANVFDNSHIYHMGASAENPVYTRTLLLDFPESVVRAAQSGDAGAVRTLFRAAWPSAYRLAWSILSNGTAAEDAAQSACARAFGALSTLRRPDRFAPWFYRIVANEAKQLQRASARELPFESVDGDRRTSWRADVDTRDDRIDVRRAIDALEPGLRAAIVLRYYFGMNSADIGRILSTSPVTARWRLMIAHRQLRAFLEPTANSDLTIVQEPT